MGTLTDSLRQSGRQFATPSEEGGGVGQISEREQAIIDRHRRNVPQGSRLFRDVAQAGAEEEIAARRQQRAHAEKAPPAIAEPVRRMLLSLSDREGLLDTYRKLTPEQRQEALNLAPGIAQQLGDDRGGGAERTLDAIRRGVSSVSQPAVELAGKVTGADWGGTEEEIAFIRQLEAAAQEFSPARAGDPWYERFPLQALEMAPFSAITVGAGIGGGAAAKAGGQLLARGASAGVPGAKAAFQATGAVGRLPRAIGLKGATTKGTMQAAGTLAGITAAGFPMQYAQEIDQLKELGMEDGPRLQSLAVGTALVASALEGIMPNPFKAGKVPLRDGAMKAARSYLWEAAKRAPAEMSEEYAQGLASGVGKVVANWIDENAEERTLADAFEMSFEQGNAALGPMAFMLGVPAAVGASYSAARATRLQEITSKGPVSRKDARELGIEGNQEERTAKAIAELEALQQVTLIQSPSDPFGTSEATVQPSTDPFGATEATVQSPTELIGTTESVVQQDPFADPFAQQGVPDASQVQPNEEIAVQGQGEQEARVQGGEQQADDAGTEVAKPPVTPAPKQKHQSAQSFLDEKFPNEPSVDAAILKYGAEEVARHHGWKPRTLTPEEAREESIARILYEARREDEGFSIPPMTIEDIDLEVERLEEKLKRGKKLSKDDVRTLRQRAGLAVSMYANEAIENDTERFVGELRKQVDAIKAKEVAKPPVTTAPQGSPSTAGLSEDTTVSSTVSSDAPATPETSMGEAVVGRSSEARAEDAPKQSPRVYREMAADELDSIINPNTSSGETFGGTERFWSDNPDLAIGQGTNKGFIVELDPSGLSLKEHAKPGTAVPGVGKEFTTRHRAEEFRQGVRSVTIKPGANSPSAIRVKRFLESEVKAGRWSKAKAESGGVVYSPTGEQDAGTSRGQSGEQVGNKPAKAPPEQAKGDGPTTVAPDVSAIADKTTDKAPPEQPRPELKLDPNDLNRYTMKADLGATQRLDNLIDSASVEQLEKLVNDGVRGLIKRGMASDDMTQGFSGAALIQRAKFVLEKKKAATPEQTKGDGPTTTAEQKPPEQQPAKQPPKEKNLSQEKKKAAKAKKRAEAKKILAGTDVQSVAKRLGIEATDPDVIIDELLDKPEVMEYLERLLQKAESEKPAAARPKPAARDYIPPELGNAKVVAPKKGSTEDNQTNILNKMGVTLRIVEGGNQKLPGLFDPNTMTIWLNRSYISAMNTEWLKQGRSAESMTWGLFAHEAFHAIRRTNPEAWNKLSEWVKEHEKKNKQDGLKEAGDGYIADMVSAFALSLQADIKKHIEETVPKGVLAEKQLAAAEVKIDKAVEAIAQGASAQDQLAAVAKATGVINGKIDKTSQGTRAAAFYIDEFKTDKDVRDDESLSRYLEDRVGDFSFWNELGKTNPGLLAKIGRWLRRILRFAEPDSLAGQVRLAIESAMDKNNVAMTDGSGRRAAVAQSDPQANLIKDLKERVKQATPDEHNALIAISNRHADRSFVEGDITPERTKQLKDAGFIKGNKLTAEGLDQLRLWDKKRNKALVLEAKKAGLDPDMVVYGIRVQKGKPWLIAEDIIANGIDTSLIPQDLEARSESQINNVKRTKWDVAQWLQALYKKATGHELSPNSAHSDVAIDKMAKQLATEALHALDQPWAKRAIGWYNRKVKAALAHMADIFPEIVKPGEHQLMFKAALAISSDGQDVLPNFRMAVEIYERWKKTGTLSGSGHRSGVETSLATMDRLVKELKWKEASRFLATPITVRELAKLGYKVSGELADTRVYGAMIFGAKIGSFYNNLNYRFDTVTMDLWWSRTIGRLRGKLESVNLENAKSIIQEQLLPYLSDKYMDKFGTTREKLESDEKAAFSYARSLKSHNASVFTKTAISSYVKIIRLAAESDGIKNNELSQFDPISPSELQSEAEKKFYSQLVEKLSTSKYNGKVSDATIAAMARDAIAQRTEVNTKEFKAAKNAVVNAYGLYEIATSGKDRYIQRQIADNAIAEVKRITGKNITNADFQALMWYYEKELWSKLGLSKDIEKLDYEQAAAKVSQEYRESRRGNERELVYAGQQVSPEAAGRAQSPIQYGSGNIGSQALGSRESRAAVARSGKDATPAVRGRVGPDGRVWSRSQDRRTVGGYDLAASYQADSPEWAESGVSTPTFIELQKSEKSASQFTEAINAARTSQGELGASVYVYPEQDYRDMRLFLTEDGKAGFALKDPGDPGVTDIVSVFNTAGGAHRGVSYSMMRLAVEEGGNTLDAFDTFLPSIYSANGFRVIARTKWNDEFSPEGWNKDNYSDFNNGEPDVVFMAYDPQRTDIYRHNSGEGKVFDDYDEAVKSQRAAATAGEKAVSGQDDSDVVDPNAGVRFAVARPDVAKKLNVGKKVTLYRAMMLIDGKLYPPMSSRIKDEAGTKLSMRPAEEIGQWMVSEERPDLVPKTGKNAGKFPLQKPKGTTWAAYAPYFHASPIPLNDQFSASWLNDGVKRPLMVTVEVEVPASELTSGYQAEGSSKKVGSNKWNAGVVASKIPGGREVVLSRYLRIKRVVPDSEVAEKIASIVNPSRLSIPENTVTPQLRAELEKQGVRISPKGTKGDDIRYSPGRQDPDDILAGLLKHLEERGVIKPEQADDGGEETTGTKHAKTDELRAKRGFPERVPPIPETFQEWEDQARRQYPDAAARLWVVELAESNPESIGKIENAAIGQHIVDLENRREAGEDVLDELLRTVKASTVAGTAAGQALVSRKAERYSDFSLAGLVDQHIDLVGKDPTNEQMAKYAEMADKIKALEGDLDVLKKKLAKAEVDKAIAEAAAAKNPPPPKAGTKKATLLKKVANGFAAFQNAWGGGTSWRAAVGRSPIPDIRYSPGRQDPPDVRAAADDIVSALREMGVSSYLEFQAQVRANMPNVSPDQMQVFKDSWDASSKKAKVESPLGENPNDAAIGALARDLTRWAVESGIEKREDVISAVHKELQDMGIEITRSETMAAMSGYGDFRELPKDEVSKTIRGIKGEIQQLLKLEDMQAGQAPKKTGVERREQTEDERILIKQVNEAKKKGGYEVTDPDRQLKSALGTAKTAIRNRISDLEQEIKSREKIVKEQTPLKEDAELIALREKRDLLLKEHRKIFPPKKSVFTDAQRLRMAEALLDRQIDELKADLNAGRLGPKDKRDPITSASLQAKKAELARLREIREQAREASPAYQAQVQAKRTEQYKKTLEKQLAFWESRRDEASQGKLPEKRQSSTPTDAEILEKKWQIELVKREARVEIEHAERAARSPGMKALGFGGDLLDLARAIQTGYELSATLRQGAFYTVGFPKKALPALVKSIEAAFSRRADFALHDNLLKRANHIEYMKGKLETTAADGPLSHREEAIRSRLASWLSQTEGWKWAVPRWAAEGLLGSERAFRSFSNTMRADLFDYMKASVDASRPGTWSEDDAKVLAHASNVISGRAPMQHSVAWGRVLYAPRWVWSRALLAVGEPVWRGDKATRLAVGKVYVRAALGMAALQTIKHIIYSLLADDDEHKPKYELDWRSSDFGKTRIGDTRLDTGAGINQLITLTARLSMGQTKRQSGEIVDLRGDNVPYGADDTADVMSRFLRTKLAPLPSGVIDWIAGENIVGEKATVGKIIGDRLTPMTWSDIWDAEKELNIPQGTVAAIESFLGTGVSTYGDKTEYRSANAEGRQEKMEKDLKHLEWDSPAPAYAEFLTEDQLAKFDARRHYRFGSKVSQATGSPESDGSIAARDEAIAIIKSSGVTLEQAKKDLVEYWEATNTTKNAKGETVRGKAKEMKNGDLVYKDAVQKRFNILKKLYEAE